MRTGHWGAGIALAVVLVVVMGCDGDGGTGTAGSETGPIGTCNANAMTQPLASGSFAGRFSFGISDPVTFPLRLDIDVDRGTVSGDLGFQDATQAYTGSMDGTVDANGSVSGTLRATGAQDGRSIEGTFSGQLDGLGGCGEWNNAAMQSGRWQVGEHGKPTGTDGSTGGPGPSSLAPCDRCEDDSDCDSNEDCVESCCAMAGLSVPFRLR